MEEKEYNQAMDKIISDFEQAKKDLYIKYGLSQAKYSKGDIIGNGIVIIKVEKITVHKSFGLPDPVYHGIELKKDFTPKKSGDKSSIYGNKNVTLYERGGCFKNEPTHEKIKDEETFGMY